MGEEIRTREEGIRVLGGKLTQSNRKGKRFFGNMEEERRKPAKEVRGTKIVKDLERESRDEK